MTVNANANANARSSNRNQTSKNMSTSTSTKQSRPAAHTTTTVLDDEQHKELLTYALYAIAFLVFVKLVLSTVTTLVLLLAPVLVLAHGSCPSPASFDAKKELKRVLRGHHLPDTNPHKPKSWLDKTVAKVTASVATELATSIGGYEQSFVNLAGFATVAVVTVDAANVECTWIGAFHKWFYVMQREVAK